MKKATHEMFIALPSYMISQAKEILALQVETSNQVSQINSANEVSKTIGGKKIVQKLTEQDKAEFKKAVITESDERIQNALAELKDELAYFRKSALQEYYAARPRPTDIERGEILSLVREYQASGDSDKEQKFKDQRSFHIENETVEALIYIMAGRELGIGVDPSEMEIDMPEFNYNIPTTEADSGIVEYGGLRPLMNPPHPSDNDPYREQAKRMKRMNEERERAAKVRRSIDYIQSRIAKARDAKIRFETDQLLMKLYPDLKTAQYHLDCVAEADRLYEIFCLQSSYDMNLNAGELHVNGEDMRKKSMDEERHFKNRMIELGVNPSNPIDFANLTVNSTFS